MIETRGMEAYGETCIVGEREYDDDVIVDSCMREAFENLVEDLRYDVAEEKGRVEGLQLPTMVLERELEGMKGMFALKEEGCRVCGDGGEEVEKTQLTDAL